MSNPPANNEIEQALIGQILARNDVYDDVADMLFPEHFSDPLHADIYDAVGSLVHDGKIANAISLKHLFNGHKLLEGAGGDRYLAALQGLLMPGSPKDYAASIIDLYQRREAILLAQDILEDAQRFTLDDKASGLIDRMAERIFELQESGLGTGIGLRSIGKAAQEALGHVEEAAARGGGLTGLGTGLLDLDELIGGLEAPDLILLAGRPSMGKTAMAMKIAYNVGAKRVINPEAGGVVGFFSLEMSAAQLALRVLNNLTGISIARMRRGYTSEGDRADLHRKADRVIDPLPVYIDDQAALTVQQIHTRARRLKRRSGLSLIVVDHLGFIKHSGEHRNKVHQIEENTGGLRTVAKDLNVPILLLSQLSRALESRDDKRPLLSDLRDSGAIEQDADVVCFLHREEYFIRRAGEKRKEGMTMQEQFNAEDRFKASLEKWAGIAEVIVAKQRNGPVGTVRLCFDDAKMDFSNLAKDQEGQ